MQEPRVRQSGSSTLTFKSAKETTLTKSTQENLVYGKEQFFIVIKTSAGTPADLEFVRVAKELLAQDELEVQKTHRLITAPALFERAIDSPSITEQRQRDRRGQQQERRWPESGKRRRC